MRNNLVSVVDIGTTKTVCLAAQQGEKGNLEVLAIGTADNRGIRKGTVHNVEAVQTSVAEATKKVEAAIGRELGKVTISVLGTSLGGHIGQGIVEVIPNGRAITRDDVLKVINHSRRSGIPTGNEQVQAIPRIFRTDGFEVTGTPIGQPAGRLEVSTYIAHAPSEVVRTFEHMLDTANLELNAMVVQPLASGLGVLHPSDLERGAIVVDIGHGITSIAYFVEGSLAYLDTLPVGSGHVTGDIKYLLKTSTAEADRLKHHYAAAVAAKVGDDSQVEVLQEGMDTPRPMQRRVFCEIVESRMREIARLSKESIEKSGYNTMTGSGVLVTGGGSMMPYIEVLFAEVFDGPKVKTCAPKVGGPAGRQASRPEMASAVGLARYAIDQGEGEFSSADGAEGWREKVKTFWSLFSG
jgi:cell division protein FtsA